MIEPKKLEKIVSLLNKVLMNPGFAFTQAGSILRPETASIADLRTNLEFQEELEESKLLEDTLFFPNEDVDLPNQAYIQNGQVVIIVDGSRCIIPIDDINDVKIIKASGERMMGFVLCDGYIDIMWMSKKQMDESIKWSRKWLDNMMDSNQTWGSL